MKKSDNNINQDDFKRIWKASDQVINKKYKLTSNDMEKIILKEGTSFLKKFRANIYFDIVFKSLLCAGLIIVWTIYPSNLLITGTTFFLTLLNLLIGIRLAHILRAGQSTGDLTKSTVETLKTAMGFYSGQSAVVPLSWGLSAGTFFILGSFVYHHFKYGIIEPFQDIQDIVVLSSILFIAIVMAYFSHHYATRDQFKNLNKLADELNDEARFLSNKRLYHGKKINRYLLGIILSLIGMVLLIALIILLNS